jgi:phage terminase small subunit
MIMPAKKDLESLPKVQPLTPKQRRFIEEYATSFNAHDAALKAGYSAKTARNIACENLSKPYIKRALQEKMDELTTKSQDKIIGVLQRLHETINADITNFVDDEGCYDPHNPEFNGKLVNSIRKGKSGTTVTLCSKDKALELLGKYLSMWQDKVDITTQGQALVPIQITFEEVGSTEGAPPT